MRGGGCIINDFWDFNFDKKVFRTSKRPLASGEISFISAFIILFIVLFISLIILIQLPKFSWIIAVIALPLIFIYPLAKRITKSVKVPTIGIGVSKYCDGQILVSDDMLGLNDVVPKFVKKYSNFRKDIDKSIKNYTKEVKQRKFPSLKNVYK